MPSMAQESETPGRGCPLSRPPPFAFSAAVKPHSLLKAPRILNEPVRCIFSNLRNISPAALAKIIRTGMPVLYFSREALFRFENIVNRYRKIVGNMHYGLYILI